MQVLTMPARIVTTIPGNIKFVILGCGGTGGYLIPNLARIISITNSKYHRNDSILLYDGDIVEDANLSRQNFTFNDIGKNKAEVLAKRYSRAFRITIDYVTEYVRENNAEELYQLSNLSNSSKFVLIGCVDNNKTRHLIHDIYRRANYYSNIPIYLDSGNEEHAGQVVFSAKKYSTTNGVKIDKIMKDAVEYYALNDNDKHPDELSCAENAIHAPQNIATNIMAANVLFNYCNLIIEQSRMIGNLNLSFRSLELTEQFSQVPSISAHITYFNSLTGAISTQGFEPSLSDTIRSITLNKTEWDEARREENARAEALEMDRADAITDEDNDATNL